MWTKRWVKVLFAACVLVLLLYGQEEDPESWELFGEGLALLYCQGEHNVKPPLQGAHHSRCHLRRGLAVHAADRSAARAARGAVAHQFVDHANGDALFFEPGGVGVPEVVRAVQVEMAEAEVLERGVLGGLAGAMDGALVDAAEVVAGEHRPSAARDARAGLPANAAA